MKLETNVEDIAIPIRLLSAWPIIVVLIACGCNPGGEPGTLANARTNEQRAMYIYKPPAPKPAPSAPAATSPAAQSEIDRLRHENDELRQQNEQLKTQLQNK